MGLFDSVFAKCPLCDRQIEFQSKAGECDLKRYTYQSVPAEIAKAIKRQIKTCTCGATLFLNANIPRISMHIELASDKDDENDENWD